MCSIVGGGGKSGRMGCQKFVKQNQVIINDVSEEKVNGNKL